MMKIIFVVLCGCLMLSSSLQAAIVVHQGKFVQADQLATSSMQEHFAAGACAYEEEKWSEAAKQFSIVSINFPTTSYGQEAFYFLGVSLYFLEEYDMANCAFSEYLKVQSNPRYFQSAVEFKFCIAEHFNAGARRRPFGTKQLPKWFTGQSLALEIYDEVIAAVPCHEIAAQALISKACLLWRWQDYRPAVEAFQMVIRRFPKYESTPDCYLYIGKIYLEQSQWEFQNSDILAFAQINLKKFERDFPREERLCEAQDDVMSIKEVYARGLYDTGQFYERTCKPRAAIIYYNDAIRQFPDTCVAQLCIERMLCLDASYSVDLPKVITENEPSEDSEDKIDDSETDESLVDFGPIE